jgi:CubicO group peptidase (beta-lactamase class C family)
MKKLVLFYMLFVASSLNAQFPNTFVPDAFNDPTRLERIQKAIPVIEKMYKDYALENNFPGYAYGIVVDGQLLYKGASGYANLEEKIPATTSSMFRIASMSKSFTSMAILQLRDAGKLNLDDLVEKYIPAMKGQGLTKDAPPITIRHLMSHSAGFPEDNPWGDRQLADTEKDLLDLIQQKISFSNTAGIHYEYSNLGFAMLGYIIHKVSGETYDAYIQKHILAPLGMQATSFEYASISKDKFANGYRYINNEWKKETPLHNGIYGAMGGMITSIDQFGKYVAMHENAWPERNDAETFPVKRSTIREMHQPVRFMGLKVERILPTGKKMTTANSYTYGLKWMIDEDHKKSIGHTGGLPGFGSNWRILPDYGIGVMLFANVTYAATSPINIAVLDSLVQMAKLKPRLVKVSPILAQRQAELVKIIVNWTEISPVFAENFFDDYPVGMLKKESQEVFSQVGNIKKINPMVAENQLRGFCLIECEKGIIKLAFTLTPENPALIQEYHLTIE